MKATPITAYQETKGMIYFARMLDKIRKHARAELRDDFHENLGIGLDGRCCGFLRVKYNDLKSRTLQGGSDDDVLDWCFATGRPLDSADIFIWNEFVRKRGWRDSASDMLAERKREAGWTDRDEIATMIEYFEYDEGRKS